MLGYQRQDIRLDTLADVLVVLNELNKKAGIRFDIDVKRPPKAEGWTCSLTFDGNNRYAEHNADLCLFLERYAEERERLETYWTDQEYFDQWLDREIAYYAWITLPDKEVEALTYEERLTRRNELFDIQKEAAKTTEDNCSH